MQPVQRYPVAVLRNPVRHLGIPIDPTLPTCELATRQAREVAMDRGPARRAGRPERIRAGQAQFIHRSAGRALAQPFSDLRVPMQPRTVAGALVASRLEKPANRTAARCARMPVTAGTGIAQLIQGVPHRLRSQPRGHLGIAIQAPPVAVPPTPPGRVEKRCNTGSGWRAVWA